MKLSDYIRHFDELDKQEQNNAKNVLTKSQATIFKDIFSTFQTVRYGLLDGGSGTGKTVLIRAIQKYCESKGINCVVTASTGKASSALNGQTIHSYMGLSMVQNDEATTKDEALTLSFNNDNEDKQSPDILIIDEASMIGQKLFAQIDKSVFKYVLFVMDSNQLPPVKEKKVNWHTIADRTYTLTETLRAKDEDIAQLFSDFKAYKEGLVDELDLMSYVNDRNIVTIDYKDIDRLPINTECCFVGYRNKLVENLSALSTDSNHTMMNLNSGVNATLLVSTSDTTNDNGYFNREFTSEQSYYNGEDVEIIKLGDVVDKLTAKGYAYYNNFKLSLNKKKTGITIINTNNVIKYNHKEAIEPKQFLQFPKNEVLECCTLSVVDNKVFTLLWDETESEFNSMLDHYFGILLPHLSKFRVVKSYFKDRRTDISSLPYKIKDKMKNSGRKEFMEWYSNSQYGLEKSRAWADFLSAKSVVSARPTTSRTIHKAQGISIPAVVITDQSFYGASLSAQYVAVTRGKQGIVLVQNTPKELVLKD